MLANWNQITSWLRQFVYAWPRSHRALASADPETYGSDRVRALDHPSFGVHVSE
jgi:hypothetical protein